MLPTRARATDALCLKSSPAVALCHCFCKAGAAWPDQAGWRWAKATGRACLIAFGKEAKAVDIGGQVADGSPTAKANATNQEEASNGGIEDVRPRPAACRDIQYRSTEDWESVRDSQYRRDAGKCSWFRPHHHCNKNSLGHGRGSFDASSPVNDRERRTYPFGRRLEALRARLGSAEHPHVVDGGEDKCREPVQAPGAHMWTHVGGEQVHTAGSWLTRCRMRP